MSAVKASATMSRHARPPDIRANIVGRYPGQYSREKRKWKVTSNHCPPSVCTRCQVTSWRRFRVIAPCPLELGRHACAVPAVVLCWCAGTLPGVLTTRTLTPAGRRQVLEAMTARGHATARASWHVTGRVPDGRPATMLHDAMVWPRWLTTWCLVTSCCPVVSCIPMRGSTCKVCQLPATRSRLLTSGHPTRKPGESVYGAARLLYGACSVLLLLSVVLAIGASASWRGVQRAESPRGHTCTWHWC
jgi:hypothetical protein